jgi:hypothetical protein
MIIYRTCFFLMEVGYLGLTLQAPDLRTKAIGFVLLVANALIFWR